MKISALLLILFVSLPLLGQTEKTWTEADRKYLLENLTRSRDELIKETAHLSPAQWKFKESADRWSINEVVEHIAIWELLLEHEITRALTAGYQPELYKTAKPDSLTLGFLMEDKPHISIEYTKPYTYTLPMGLNDLKNNMAWFLKLRNESLDYIAVTKEDLRGYSMRPGRPNIHQVYITIFGHADRHLRQIRKVKQHKNYPK